MKKITLISLGLLLSISTFAQSEENNFNIAAQIRSRAEYRNGSFYPRSEGVDPAFFINYRSRLSIGYAREKLSLGFSVQHVGVWGQDPQVDMNGRFMLNEAWANFSPANGFFIKFGRQSLAYDDERILGGLDWNVSGRFHDALKMGYENPKNKLHLVLAFNQNSEKQFGGTYYAPGGQPYKKMQTLWYQYINSKVFNISFLLLNLGMEAGDPTKTDVKSMQTFGTNLSFQPGSFQVYGTFYLQTGKTVANKSISAFMGAVNASYSFSPVWKIIVASDYLSGNDANNPDKYKAFSTVYGTNHKFYGTMDYFYASPFINGLNPGLWDNQLGVSCKASPKLTLALNYHHFQTTTDIKLRSDALPLDKIKRSLGSEFDLQFTWNIMKDITMMGGYSTMFGSDSMKTVKGGDPSKWQDWMWISLNINPKIFVTKW